MSNAHDSIARLRVLIAAASEHSGHLELICTYEMNALVVGGITALPTLLDVAEAAVEYQAANEWAEESVWVHDEGSMLSADELKAYRETIDLARHRANDARRVLFDAIERLENVK